MAVALQDTINAEGIVYENPVSANKHVPSEPLRPTELQVLPQSGSCGNPNMAQERRVQPMSQGHAFLPPSGASSWSKCALWATMNRQFPESENAEAVEGTAAHWLSWEFLTGKLLGTDRLFPVVAPNGTVINDEMLEAAELVKDTIQDRIIPRSIHIETAVASPSIHPEVWGTPDVWGIAPDEKSIEIFDFKYGHRFVDEWWNPQGLCYLAGILDYLKVNLDYGISVSFTVIQPRCFYRGAPVRTHTFKLTEARPYFNQLAMAAERALQPNPTATTNDHCGDCNGRHACSALQLAAYTDAEYSNSRIPVQLSPSAAALELRMLQRSLDRLTARVDGLKEQTIANIRRGEQVPYFRAEPGYGRQSWKIPETQIVAIGDMFGQNLRKEGTLTPKQAEKAGIDSAIIKEYSHIPTTGFRLVPEDSNHAARTFGALKEGE